MHGCPGGALPDAAGIFRYGSYAGTLCRICASRRGRTVHRKDYIAESVERGKVIGEFTCDRIYELETKARGGSYYVKGEDWLTTCEVAQQACLTLAAQLWTEVTAMRLIDRDAIHWRPDENWELYATAADIRAIPTVDAVVVTRCKDCKYLVNATVNDNGFLICDISDMEIAPDDFCSRGEKGRR